MEDIGEILKKKRSESPFKPHPVPGLVGGMGPESTLEFYRRILDICQQQGARKDQDHLQVLISILPQTPDRTQAILGQGENPLPYLMESASRLELAGADFLVVVCNTAHYYLEELRQRCNVPVLSFEEETLSYLKAKHPPAKKVGFMATHGTYQAGIYRRILEKEGYEFITPEQEVDRLMEAIYGKKGIKAAGVNARSRKTLEQIATKLIQQGAEILLLACTEISLALRRSRFSIPVVDTMDVAAQRVVEIASMAWKDE